MSVSDQHSTLAPVTREFVETAKRNVLDAAIDPPACASTISRLA